MSFLRLSKSRPDKHTNRMAWNESWEKDLDIYETFRYKFPSIPLLQPPNHSPKDRIGVEMGLMAFNQTFHNDLFLLQQDVCRRATTRLATDDFAEKWTALKPACREEYILEALYKTSTAGPDFEQFRQWCPDLKVDTLGREGASYLDLLMFLIQSNSEANGKVALVFFPHPMVDRIFNAIQDLEGQTYALKLRMNRSFFITMTLWRTYLAFFDLDEIYRFDTTGQPSKKQRKKAISRSTATGTTSFKSAEEEDAYRRGRLEEFLHLDTAKGEITCWRCGKTEGLLPAGTQLRACSGCKEIQRKVLYCSRECQKLDWKEGVGSHQPHKVVCGKPFIHRSPTAPSSNVEKIPPPDPSFKRPAALLHQISFLKRENNPDYVFVQKTPEPDMGITIPDLTTRGIFLAWRQRALKNGDPVAVRAMYSILQKFAQRFAPRSYNLKKQLEAEYGGVLSNSADESADTSLTEEELRESVDILLSFDEVIAQLSGKPAHRA